MGIGRRDFVRGGAAGLAFAPFAATPGQAQQAPTPPAPVDRVAARVAERASQARMRLEHHDGVFSGAGWEHLLTAGGAATMFMLGEEHGIAENAKLAGALFAALAPSGYRRVAVETSPQSAFALDRAARSRAEIDRYLGDPVSFAAFFGMREEADWLLRARAAVPARETMFWGLDYEIGADRRLIRDLEAQTKPQAAAQALAAVKAASDAAWAVYEQGRDISKVYSFNGDPALIRAVRDAWPNAPERAGWALETLEETLSINRLWGERRGYESNARRALLMRRNLLRHWRAEAAPKPRLFMKFGLYHMTRGLTGTGVFDIGTLAPELAAIEGGRAFQLAVLAGATANVAQLDPATLRYKSGPAGDAPHRTALEALYANAYPDAFTLYDTASLRSAVGGNMTANPELQRMIHGFDAILIMTGSTASANL